MLSKTFWPKDFSERDEAIVWKIIQASMPEDPSRFETFRVLEWGSGSGTAHWAYLIDKEVNRRGLNPNGIQFVSVEHNRQWRDGAQAMLGQLALDISASVRLRGDKEPTPVNSHGKEVPGDAYVRFNDQEMIDAPDVIIVDGRRRRECLIQAKRYIYWNGWVILHDAQRDYYHCALKEYPHGWFIGDALWVGRVTPYEGRVLPWLLQ